jgi:hypothetical protein
MNLNFSEFLIIFQNFYEFFSLSDLKLAILYCWMSEDYLVTPLFVENIAQMKLKKDFQKFS